MTTIALANTSITSHNYQFFLVVRTFKIYSLSNLQVYNTVSQGILQFPGSSTSRRGGLGQKHVLPR